MQLCLYLQLCIIRLRLTVSGEKGTATNSSQTAKGTAKTSTPVRQVSVMLKPNFNCF